MVCGLVGSLPTVTAMLEISADPPPVGVNVTATVQLDFGDAIADPLTTQKIHSRLASTS